MPSQSIPEEQMIYFRPLLNDTERVQYTRNIYLFINHMLNIKHISYNKMKKRRIK